MARNPIRYPKNTPKKPTHTHTDTKTKKTTHTHTDTNTNTIKTPTKDNQKKNRRDEEMPEAHKLSIKLPPHPSFLSFFSFRFNRRKPSTRSSNFQEAISKCSEDSQCGTVCRQWTRLPRLQCFGMKNGHAEKLTHWDGQWLLRTILILLVIRYGRTPRYFNLCRNRLCAAGQFNWISIIWVKQEYIKIIYRRCIRVRWLSYNH